MRQHVTRDSGKRFLVQMEDDYRVTISEDRNSLLVENLSVIDSCAVNIYDIDGETREHIRTGQWESLICGLISIGHLD